MEDIMSIEKANFQISYILTLKQPSLTYLKKFASLRDVVHT